MLTNPERNPSKSTIFYNKALAAAAQDLPYDAAFFCQAPTPSLNQNALNIGLRLQKVFEAAEGYVGMIHVRAENQANSEKCLSCVRVSGTKKENA